MIDRNPAKSSSFMHAALLSTAAAEFADHARALQSMRCIAVEVHGEMRRQSR